MTIEVLASSVYEEWFSIELTGFHLGNMSYEEMVFEEGAFVVFIYIILLLGYLYEAGILHKLGSCTSQERKNSGS